MRLPSFLEFFSLGGVLAACWKSRPSLVPWILTSFSLLGLSFWDLVARGGRIDFIVLGLAAYELALGLIETSPSTTTT
jgi:hypothetical protein